MRAPFRLMAKVKQERRNEGNPWCISNPMGLSSHRNEGNEEAHHLDRAELRFGERESIIAISTSGGRNDGSSAAPGLLQSHPRGGRPTTGETRM